MRRQGKSGLSTVKSEISNQSPSRKKKFCRFQFRETGKATSEEAEAEKLFQSVKKKILPGLVCQLSPPMNIFLKQKKNRHININI